MLASYGYSDGSGAYFITVDTDKCDGCGDCVSACPVAILEVVDEDPNDPLSEEPIAVVAAHKRNKLRYECAACKPATGRPPLPCVQACRLDAISHSW
jgi:ferredoxin